MTRRIMALMAALSMVSVLSAGAMAQRRGFCGGAGPRGYGYQARPGGGGAWAGGGWWTRVQPTTPEQQAFVSQVSDLHGKIRALNFEIWTLKAAGGRENEVAAKEKAVADLRAELARVTAANEKLLREMGIPAPYGVCTGTGPRWQGGPNGQPGAFGRGFGRGGFGMGMRLRDGSGPNPYCPLKQR